MRSRGVTTRTDRLDLIARLLRDQPGITAATIADTLGVSLRSVFRDLELLRERGYPVESARGRGGGLRLHRSYGLGRVLLSSEEALCTLLALAISEKVGMPMFASAATRARRRIVDAFPSHERKRIGPLRERIFVGTPASARVRASYAEPAATPSRDLQAAFVEERVVVARYAREDGSLSERLLEPHALVINWPAWYLVAFDHSRGSPRTFRLDRFQRVVPQPGTFRPRPADMVSDLIASGEVRLEAL
jgi:predicted DNA-binding transcriptional regulator YafY